MQYTKETNVLARYDEIREQIIQRLEIKLKCISERVKPYACFSGGIHRFPKRRSLESDSE